MEVYGFLIPMALGLAGLFFGALVWSLRSGQFEDLDGAAHRVLIDEDAPLTERADEALER